MERDKETKEDLKTVALGTSKINYLDPRITVAWCKRSEVPIEKVRTYHVFSGGGNLNPFYVEAGQFRLYFIVNVSNG